MSAPSRGPRRGALPWAAALLILAALAGVLLLGTARVPPSFPAVDPTRMASLDWPRLLPMAWLASLGLLPWALGASRPRLARALLGLALLPILWLHLHPEPFEEQRLLKVDHDVGSVTVVEGGELVQRQWLRSVQTQAPLLQLPLMLRSERAVAGIAHAIHHRADPSPDHAYPRALLWAAQRWSTVGWLALRFLTLPLALWLGLAALSPRLVPRRALPWVGLGLLLPLAIPPLVNLLLIAGIQLMGLPDASGQAGDFALQQLAWLGIIALSLSAHGLGRRPWLAPVAAGLLLAACQGPSQPTVTAPIPSAPEGASEGPDIVLVLAAGARSWIGTGEETTPTLRRELQAQGSAMYTSAYAQSPSSFVSLGSVLTGRYPTAIPMCGLPVLDDDDEERPWCAAIPPERHTLPEVLGLYGYRTALLYANLPAGEVFAPEFHEVHDLTVDRADSRADWEALHRVAQEFWRRDHDKPHLLVVVVGDLVLSQRPDLEARTGWSGTVPKLVEPMLAQQPELAQAVTGPDDPEQLYASYHQAIHGLAGGIHGLQRLLAETSDRPRWLIVAGLNGINLGERGGGAEDHPTWGDNPLLLERTVHVPLLFVPPTPGEERRITQPVELVDLFPTLATLAQAMPPAGLPGQDLLEEPFPEDPQAWAYASHGDMLALRQGAMMYSVRGLFHNGTALDPEVTDLLFKAQEAEELRHLHHVIEDPLQQTELREAHPQELHRMHELMVAIRTGAAATPEESLTPQRLWELRMTRSEGYW
jgi:arylsulfatase A-like enzyme